MYLPKHFAGDEAVGREVMQAHSWALLMTTDEAGAPFATHLSLLWQDDGSEHGALIGHLARANPHWKLFERPVESLALFWGPHAYVSPTWYTPGPKVPTWNYVTVHAYGRPQIVDDTKGHTVASASTMEGDLRGFEGDKTAKARKVGELVAERAKKAGVEAVVFDRGGNRYAGRVAAIAEGAREGGLDL